MVLIKSMNYSGEEIINKKIFKNAQKYPIYQALSKNKSDLEAKN